jgi:hypothetical protein
MGPIDQAFVRVALTGLLTGRDKSKQATLEIISRQLLTQQLQLTAITDLFHPWQVVSNPDRHGTCYCPAD